MKLSDDTILYIGDESYEGIFDLIFYITDSCNFKCSYCSPDNYKNTTNLNYESYVNVIDTAISNINKNKIRVTITGGEPTTVSCLLDIVKYFTQLPEVYEITVITNLSKPTDYYMMFVGLCTFTASYHNEWSAHKPFFDKILQMDQVGLIECINFMLEVTKVKPLLDIIDEIQTLDFFSKIQFIPLYHTHVPEYDKYINNDNHIITVKKNDGSIEYKTFAECKTLGYDKFRFYKCEAGYSMIFLKYNGDVSRCPDLRHRSINIFKNIEDFRVLTSKIKHCPIDICNCEIGIPKRHRKYEGKYGRRL